MGLEGFILLGETVVQKRVSFTCQYAGVLSSFLAGSQRSSGAPEL